MNKAVEEINAFAEWVAGCRRHHDFEELTLRLRAFVAGNFDDAQAAENAIFWEAWRASQWTKKQHDKEFMDVVWKELEAGRDLESIPKYVYGFQHGPFVFQTPIFKMKRVPARGTMVAAQMVSSVNVIPDWGMIAMLLDVTGIEPDVAPESLRVRVRKFLKLVEQKQAVFVGWPGDVGHTVASICRATGRRQI